MLFSSIVANGLNFAALVGATSWQDANTAEKASSKPAVVFCHAAWLDPHYLYKTSSSLRDRGHEVYAPALATHKGPPSAGLQADARVIDSYVSRLVEREGKEVVLIGHSYGGGPCGEAALPQYSKSIRRMLNQTGGITRLILVAAAPVLPGQSPTEAAGQALSPINSTTDLIDVSEQLADLLVMGLPTDLRDQALANLSSIPALAFFSAGINPGYLWSPVTYVHTLQDQFFMAELQAKFVSNMRELGSNVTEVNINSTHVPFWTAPDAILSVLTQAIDG